MTEVQIGKLTSLIQSHVPSAQCNSNVGTELSYLLNAADVDRFVKLFQVKNSNFSNSRFLIVIAKAQV